MAQKTVTDITAWPGLTLEGNLLSPAMIATIDRREASEQDEASYGVRKGLTIRDEIALAFRVGQAHYDAFSKANSPTLLATTRFMRDFLRETLAFDDLVEMSGGVALVAGDGRAPIVIVPPADPLDRKSASLSQERARSAAFVLQDRLNADDDALWGLATNGSVVRLMRDNASLTRPAFIEANLAQIFQTEDMASFAVLWLIFHRTRFGRAGSPATDCVLERWRDAGAKAGEAARNRLASQVEQALEILGSGFLGANKDLRDKIAAREIALTDWFNELLHLVYRLIFLMVAEDRSLLHTPEADPDARRLYGDGYSLTHLRAQSARRAAWDRYHDRYESLKIVFRALAQGEAALGLPALGGLFTPGQLATLENARLSNRAFLSALFRLGWLTDSGSMTPVNWQAMETEELGSVYESLLELQPQLSDDGRELRFASEVAEQKGNQRKTTGSYYTPDSLVQALLDTALDPVLDRAEAEADDPAVALLNLTVIDPACGSGHFLLAAARRIATRVARHRAAGTPSPTDFRHALRDVARRCIYGVDRNPMAVELTKVALWIETVDPGLPLGYFEAQVRCGDSLLGLIDLKALEEGIPDAAYKHLTGDDKETAKHFTRRNRSEREGQGSLDFVGGGGGFPAAKVLADIGGKLRALPENTLDDIAGKARLFANYHASEGFRHWKLACDMYVASFLAPKTGDASTIHDPATVPTTGDLWKAMAGQRPHSALITRVAELANRARAFHWPLEFPDVIRRGGFDIVLGNPPWERIKIQEHEFFASRDPVIGSQKSAKARSALIAKLRDAPVGSAERTLYLDFEGARREAEATSTFVLLSGDDGGRFPLCGRGDVNTYALFAELFDKLKKAEGKAGIIVPTGIATDALTAPFFAELVREKRLVRLVDFENREAIFPGVHRSYKFCLLTMGKSESAANFSFFLTAPAQLAEPERNFTLTPEQIAKINPNTKTAPVFRSRTDAELTVKIYHNAPVLIEKSSDGECNPWGITHASTFFDMTRDAGFFSSFEDLQQCGLALEGNRWLSSDRGDLAYLPLFEAKMLHIFDHRWSSSEGNGDDDSIGSTQIKADTSYEPIPRFWVSVEEVRDRLQRQGWRRDWLIGIRKIARATDERTIIPTILPIGAVGNSEHLIFPNANLPAEKLAYFVGASSSLTLDYVARQKIGGTNLNFFYLEQLPFPPPDQASDAVLAFVCPRILELTYTSCSLAPFARDLGHDAPPFSWDEDRRAYLRADLDAFYARAYGLDRDELRYILDPADVKGVDYPSETFRVLKDKEKNKYGEYHTCRLVLEAWDRMEGDGTFHRLRL